MATETTTTETVTVRIDGKFKTTKLSSEKSKTFRAMMYPVIRDGRLLATCGRALVSVPVEVRGEAPGDITVPRDALKAAEKAGARGTATVELSENDYPRTATVTVPKGPAVIVTEDVRGSTFPRTDGLAPDDTDRTVYVTINTGILANLLAAMGSPKTIRLALTPEGDHWVRKGIKVASGDGEAFGVLMPVVVPEGWAFDWNL